MVQFARHSYGSDQVMAGMRRRKEEQNKKEQQMVTAYMTAAKTGTLDKFPQQMLQMIQQNYPQQYQMGQAFKMQKAKSDKQDQMLQEDRQLSSYRNVISFLMKNEEKNKEAIGLMYDKINAILSERTGVDLSDVKYLSTADRRKAVVEKYSGRIHEMLRTATEDTLEQYRENAVGIKSELELDGRLTSEQIEATLAPLEHKLLTLTKEKQAKQAKAKAAQEEQAARAEWDRQQKARAAAPSTPSDFERAFQGRRDQELNRAEFKNQVWTGQPNKGEAARQAQAMLDAAFDFGGAGYSRRPEVYRAFAKNSKELGPIDAATQTIRELGGKGDIVLPETIKTTSAAKKWLMDNQGMSAKEAEQWLRDNQ